MSPALPISNVSGERNSMKRKFYLSMPVRQSAGRRNFIKSIGLCTVAAGGLVLGRPSWADPPSSAVETNLPDFLKIPRTKYSLPGPFPGRVVRIQNSAVWTGDRIDAKVAAGMVESGITRLTGKNPRESFHLFFAKEDIVGIKVNPVGPPLIQSKVEVVEAVIHWLTQNGLPTKNIVIWDRFDYMLKDAGYTSERFPGVAVEGLQTMDESGQKWRGPDGRHLSENNFDKQIFYFAKGVLGKSVEGYPDDEFYLNQHVFNGEYSYFGKLLTQRLTKIINIASFKNTGNGISMATKNLGYGSLCNTGRLHKPLFFRVCAEVLAAPVLRDKLALNITDGLRGQYDGGPDKNAQFIYPLSTLFFATDPFALDMICHREMVAKRKAIGIQVNEHPRFTDYLRLAESLNLGIATPEKIELIGA
jgi:hypothetical protein